MSFSNTIITKVTKRAYIFILSIIFMLAINTKAYTEVTMPKVFGTNMVLQRNAPINVWGWAKPGEKVVVSISGQKVTTRADKKGDWKIALKALPVGTEYTMTIKGENTIEFTNILVGDVWLCSGQSNMNWPVKLSDNAELEIKNANYPNIRLFDVADDYSALPKKDVKNGEWKVCTPKNIPDFSAVAYFYGRNLHNSLNIPIGLITSTDGGTSVETWTSGPALSKFEYYAPIVEDVKTLDISHEVALGDSLVKEWAKSFDACDLGISKSGSEWYVNPPADDEWISVYVPQGKVNTPMDDNDGVYWYKLDFELSDIDLSSDALLALGAVNESDQVWINGQLIGETWFVRGARTYSFPSSTIKKGMNTIIIRVKDTNWRGGLWGESEGYYIQNGINKTNLSGNWLVRMGIINLPQRPETFGRLQTPTLYYNAMIAPLIPFSIAGVIWYQGESNSGRAFEYEKMFNTLITSWRNEWGLGDFPFYYVQLANVGGKTDAPENSVWAELQEAQQKTLKTPNTGMAVINDIGDFDVHPTNKQEVGRRLALIALYNHYKNDDIIYSGPVLKSQSIGGNQIELVFEHVGDGLRANDRYGYLKHFAIADDSGDFRWAQAYIKNDSTVVVHAPQVPNPKYVRYAWATNPFDANLYNSAGLPASCFRTDNFPLESDGYKYQYYRFKGK